MHPSLHATKTPDKPALIMSGSGEIVTYGQLEARSNQGAHLFRALGLQRGDGAALLMENTPRCLEVAWAAQRAGLYYTCISNRLTPEEIAYILEDSDAKALVASASALDPALIHLAGGRPVLAVDGSPTGARDFVVERSGFAETPIADQSAGTDMLYSSGTTGRPKGIRPPLPEGPLDQTNPLLEFGRRIYGMDQDTVFLSPAPLYHSAPLRWCMAVQKLGGTVVVMEKFDAEAALAAIARHGVTHGQFVPTHFVRMLKLDPAIRARYDVSSLKVASHAAAPCPAPAKSAMLDWWGPILFEFYAGTEANGLTWIGPEDWASHPGSVGRAEWGVVRICDAAGEPLPPRQVGVIYFEGGPTFAYHKDPEKTAASRNPRGWTTLGDMGWVDEDGYLYLTDRQSHVIICGGVNIYPQELENLLVTHPKVADVAVVGAPDEEMGEKVVAVIQPTDWSEAGPALANELSEWLRPRIGRLKQPRAIDFDPALPRHPNGKLVKRLVRDRYWPAPEAAA